MFDMNEFDTNAYRKKIRVYTGNNLEVRWSTSIFTNESK